MSLSLEGSSDPLFHKKIQLLICISTFEGVKERFDGVFGNCVIQVLKRPNESGNGLCLRIGTRAALSFCRYSDIQLRNVLFIV